MRRSSGCQPTGVPGPRRGPTASQPHLSHRVFHDVLWIVGDGGVRRRQGRARLVEASEQVGVVGELLPASRAPNPEGHYGRLDAQHIWPELSGQISGVRCAQGFSCSS
jgi:hypothetical protein